MPFTLTMPEVGETVTEGIIERWLKKPGEQINKYEPIVEINTDKVDVELPSPVTGKLIEILAPEGSVVAVGAPLATIETGAGEQQADIAPPRPAAEEEAVSAAERKSATSASPPSTADTGGEKARSTPRVRKLAAELGIDLAHVAGSGPGGRIVEDDVRAAAQPVGAGLKPARASTVAGAPGADEESVALTGIRRTIAQRMSASAFSAPHAWLAVEADVTGLVALRGSLKVEFRERQGFDLTYLPFMAQTVAQALREHPYLNASWGEDHIILKRRINLGIAVATERGLLVPVVHDADRLSVTGLALAMHDLGERSRENKSRLEDVQGGTFTLDNTGAFGSILSMPVINLGQAAIISLEMITKRPAVVGDNAIAVRSVVTLCLSFDHRILDGHQAGAFLGDAKRRLEAFGLESGID